MSLQLNTQTTATYLCCYPANGMVDTTAGQSMMYWLNPGSVATATASTVGIYNGTPANVGTNTAIQMGMRTTTFTVWTWGGTILVASTGITPTANTWYHYCYTCSAISAGSQTHNLYINGVLNNSTTSAVQVAGTTTQIYYGGYPGSGGAESTTSQIDDVYYYNRQLSADEIQTIYTSRGQRGGIVYGLVARYNFNELPAGSNVVSCTDFSGNGNTILPFTAGGTPSTYTLDWANMDTRPPL